MLPDSLFQSVTAGGLTMGGVLLCMAASLLLGLLCALVHMRTGAYSKSFVATLAVLPLIVQIVIMMVNGNLGTGVAVMGAFSLIRFRSVPGTAREICSIFFAMALGLATGTGYLAFAVLFALVAGGAMLLLGATPFGEPKQGERDLRITIPESLDYDGIFDDLFDEYTHGAQLLRVRSTNMGSLFELTYRVRLRQATVPKAFLDAIRCRNGNLTVQCGRPAVGDEAL